MQLILNKLGVTTKAFPFKEVISDILLLLVWVAVIPIAMWLGTMAGF